MINKIDLINEINKLSTNNYEDVFSFIKSLNTVNSKNDICVYCPHCGSVHFVKNSKTSKWVQRYICRDCETSNTLLYRSRSTEDIWLKFIDKTGTDLRISTEVERYEKESINNS